MRLWPGKKKDTADSVLPETGAFAYNADPKPRGKKNARKAKRKVSAEVRRRFEGYLDKKSRKCWVWKGSRTADGYGQFWVSDRKVVKAHRFAYEMFVRVLGKKERLRNVCTGKNCINPACWQPVTIGATQARRRKIKI